MRPKARVKRAQTNALEWLKEAGVDANKLQQLRDAPVHISSETVSSEAEAVLAYVANPRGFYTRLCKYDSERFVTNSKHSSYCSDRCRQRALADIGIEWDPTKPQRERWGGEPPLTLSPAALSALLDAGRLALAHSIQALDDDAVSESYTRVLQFLDRQVQSQTDTQFQHTDLSNSSNLESAQTPTTPHYEPPSLDDL